MIFYKDNGVWNFEHDLENPLSLYIFKEKIKINIFFIIKYKFISYQKSPWKGRGGALSCLFKFVKSVVDEPYI